MKLFDFDIHIGDWRVLVQSRDIQNGAVQSRHITDNAVTTEKIGDGEVKSRNIAPEAVTTDKIGPGEVKSVNIGKEAVTTEKLADESVTGDEIEGNAVKNGKLAKDAVHARNIKNRSVTSEKIGIKAIRSEHIGDGQVKAVHIDKSQLDWDHLNPDLQNIIASREEGGVALSNEFGDSELIGITQKTLSRVIDRMQDQIDKLHPGSIGISISATPNIVYEDAGSNVTVTASMVDGSIADLIKVTMGNQLIAMQENVSELTASVVVNTTSTIEAEAEQQGLTYEQSTKVTGTRPYYVGSGFAYTEIINDAHKQSIKANPNGTYNVVVTTAQTRVFFVVPQSMTINRATMSGFTFPLDSPQSVIVDGTAYKVYQSSNTYDTGTLTIVIS